MAWVGCCRHTHVSNGKAGLYSAHEHAQVQLFTVPPTDMYILCDCVAARARLFQCRNFQGAWQITNLACHAYVREGIITDIAAGHDVDKLVIISTNLS